MAKFLTKLISLPSSSVLFKKILLFRDASSVQNRMLSGRWALDYDGTVQGRKVYWANMDNCGCCHGDGGAVHAKIIKKKHEIDDDDEYILPYII
jgi:hypothetical protein